MSGARDNRTDSPGGGLEAKLDAATDASVAAAQALLLFRDDLQLLELRGMDLTVADQVGHDPGAGPAGGKHPSRPECVIESLFTPSSFRCVDFATPHDRKPVAFIEAAGVLEARLSDWISRIRPIRENPLAVLLADGSIHHVGGHSGPSFHAAFLTFLAQVHSLIVQLRGAARSNANRAVEHFDAIRKMLLDDRNMDLVAIQARVAKERDAALARYSFKRTRDVPCPVEPQGVVRNSDLTDRLAREVLEAFDALEDLYLDSGSGTAADGVEAYETLFGPRALHDELSALAARCNEFKQRFRGPVQVIADFAVSSGHEALCLIAARVARCTGVRRSAIPRIRADLAAAREGNDRIMVARQEAELERACESFVKAVRMAFEGWMETREWIRRSIENEIQTRAHARTAETSSVSGGQASPVHGPTYAQAEGASEPSLGDGGPAKTLDAVCRAIRSAKQGDVSLAEGDETTGEEVMKCLEGQDRKKAADYVAPSGRLCSGGWLRRDGKRIILTAQGARDGMQRQQREQRRRSSE